MTQLELVKKRGLENDDNVRTRISQYENGIRTPKEDILEKISEALGVTSLYLSTKETTFADKLSMLLFDMDNELGVDIIKTNDNYLLDIHYNHLFQNLYEDWIQKKKELEEGKITRDEYMMWKINYNYKDAPEKPIDYGYEKWKKANRTTFYEVSIPEGYVQLDSGTLVRKVIDEKMNKK